MRKIIVAMTCALVAGCATETADTSKLGLTIRRVPLTVTSEPEGADVELTYMRGEDMRQERCVTPCTLDFPLWRTLQFRVTKPGYRLVRQPVFHWRSGALSDHVEPNPAVFVFAKEPTTP